MQTNSPEWLEFRKSKIGASDANVIMGVSEHSTILDLFLEKKNLPPRKKESNNTFILEKGHYLEEKMRAEVELETGCDFPPNICVHGQIDYLMASMDGFNAKWKMGIECKYVGQELFSKVEVWNPESNEPFPLPQYYPQIQQQYLCSGADKMAVVAITERVEMEEKECVGGPSSTVMVPKRVDNKLVYILNEHGKKTYKKILKHVPVNMEYINKELLPALMNFQKNHIESNVEPGSGDADIIEIKDMAVGKKVTEYKKNQIKIFVLNDKLKPLTVIATKLKKEIFKFEIVSQPKMSCKGVSITQITKDGDTDYESAFNSLKDNLENVILSLPNYESMAEIEASIRGSLNLNLDNFKSANKTTYAIKVTNEKKKKENEIRETHKTITGKMDGDNMEPLNHNVNIPEGSVAKVVDIEIVVESGPKGIPAAKNHGNIVDEYLDAKTNPKTTIKDNKTAWANMTPEQQTIQARSNDFKTEKGKTPRGWNEKSTNERIEYLEKLAKRNDSSENMKLISSKLADDLKTFN